MVCHGFARQDKSIESYPYTPKEWERVVGHVRRLKRLRITKCTLSPTYPIKSLGNIQLCTLSPIELHTLSPLLRFFYFILHFSHQLDHQTSSKNYMQLINTNINTLVELEFGIFASEQGMFGYICENHRKAQIYDDCISIEIVCTLSPSTIWDLMG